MNFDLKRLSAIVLLLVAVAIVTLKISSKEESSNTSERSGAGQQNRPGSATGRPLVQAPAVRPGENTSPNPGLPDEAAKKSRAEAIEKMQEASTSYDPAELPVIRPYLVHSDPELRAAAVEAMIVLGDSSAGPMLRQAAKSLASEEEAKKMEQAADYIELPPANLKEVKDMMKKRKEANDPAKAQNPDAVIENPK